MEVAVFLRLQRPRETTVSDLMPQPLYFSIIRPLADVKALICEVSLFQFSGWRTQLFALKMVFYAFQLPQRRWDDLPRGD